jgi:hypothetical protein
MFGKTMYPMSDGDLYYSIENGVRFSGNAGIRRFRR